MPFIGDFSLQNVVKFSTSTKKKSFDVSLSVGNFALKSRNSGICRNWKQVFLFLKSESLIRIQALKYRRSHCKAHVSVGESGAKVGVQIFLDNQRTKDPKVRWMLASHSAAEAFAKPIF